MEVGQRRPPGRPKEVAQRYDFKNVGASVTLARRRPSLVTANSRAERVKAVLDVLQSKLIKRGVGAQDPGHRRRRAQRLGQGVPARRSPSSRGIGQADAKKIAKLVRDAGPKGIKSRRSTGDELRVTTKSRDDLQQAIALLKGADDIDAALQFTNYR